MNKKNINRKSINLLPAFFQTSKNNKFLSSTLDQLTKAPVLDRIDGYIGSKLGKNFNPETDVYIKESLPFRQKYQLEPALVIKEPNLSIKRALGYDDLINQISYYGGDVSNLDKLFRPEFYSYDPHIDWDKFVNFREYYWLPNGPNTITITEAALFDVDDEIVGSATYTSNAGIEFINGLKIKFEGNIVPPSYRNTEYIVEGVGEAITLVEFSTLTNPGGLSTLYDTDFDQTPFDEFPFDSFESAPIIPEYVTINKASMDLNPWTRYNRWFHSDVIRASATANEVDPEFDLVWRAARPIIEFRANMQLYNFGTTSAGQVNLIDTVTTDVFSNIESSLGYYVDGQLLQDGDLVVFNADPDPLVRTKIFEVTFATINGASKINLVESSSPAVGAGIHVGYGTENSGTEWWFNGTSWVSAQQRAARNQSPVFDLFGGDGISYTETTTSGFSGNKLFGYAVGSGTPDSVLGFPLSYRNVGIEGSYLFQNYFDTETITIIENSVVTSIPTSTTFIKINAGSDSYTLKNIWSDAEEYSIPVLQFQVIEQSTSTVEITVFDSPATILDLVVTVFVDDVKQKITTDYTLESVNEKLYIQFGSDLLATTSVLLKCRTDEAPNKTGTYETPLNLTNNPFNDSIIDFTLSELSDHVGTMVDRDSAFAGVFPGVSNLKSLPSISKYGTRLIKNKNPLVFSQCFITNPENNLIDAVRKAGNDYYQFKLGLIRSFYNVDTTLSAPDILDNILTELNKNKSSSFPYALSDMLGYGDNNVTQTYTVTDIRNTDYAITSVFKHSELSNRSVLVYLNGEQLVFGQDYEFDLYDSNVRMLVTLTLGDTIVIKDYVNTVGTYIPPTPTKLGLYPKYQPSIFIDSTYASGPKKVIYGHDGSIVIAFSAYDEEDDYRDLILLEYEKRVYNNIKVAYNPELVDINDVLPGIFRESNYTYNETYSLVNSDFLKWADIYGLDFATNSTYDVDNYKTYNFSALNDTLFGKAIPGSWRAIYKYFFDTDQPNTHPWEMLGFSEQPVWWEEQYGPAPYTSGNLNLWDDLESGTIQQGDRRGIDLTYARPGLSQVIPVDDSGNLIDVRNWAGIDTEQAIPNTDQNWAFGDSGPVETAWKKSSIWPFVVQIIAALTKPANYSAKLFDTSRLVKNAIGQYVYGDLATFLNPKNLNYYSDIDTAGNVVLSSGYSVYIIEYGKQRSSEYLTTIKDDQTNLECNLFYKVGGFLSKEKLEVTIDSISPVTSNPGVYIPDEDYSLQYNVSNPIRSVPISGIIVEKINGMFSVKGYDKKYPYFVINNPIYKSTGAVVTVGGRTEPFIKWVSSSADNPTGHFYQQGQVVLYNSQYYRVLNNHYSSGAFVASNFSLLSSVPIVGGASVISAQEYETEETLIPYGTQYSTTQEVYDLILGYGNWLKGQGFIFDEYNKEVSQVIDWRFTGKEFLYWTTQRWGEGSVITLSPFANYIKFKFNDSVVDNVLNSFYEYSLLKADGTPYPVNAFSVSREDGACTISTKNTLDGFFFARLNLVQKEHAIVFNNVTLFNDIIYDVVTGYRQSRIKISGFRTGNWDGNFLSPGFIYDDAQIQEWGPNVDYGVSTVVRYVGNFYSANSNIKGSANFNFTSWTLLGETPVAELLPNFDYKINQFEDFYSLDTDNFDSGQQKMAQHLTGYTPRSYLDNIFVNPIAQYKFYQGFIREKGTRNAIDKLAKASVHNLQGQINFNEEWAFRIGSYGNYVSFNELEFPLKESEFIENSQIVQFVDTNPVLPNDPISYITPDDIVISGPDYVSAEAFLTITSSTYEDNNLLLPVAGYVRTDDITATAYNNDSLLDIANNGNISEGNTIWIGFRDDGQWDVYRYTEQSAKVINSAITGTEQILTFTTDIAHNLTATNIISVYGLDNDTDGVYEVISGVSTSSFTVATTLSTVSDAETTATLYKFVSVRFVELGDVAALTGIVDFVEGDLIWVDADAAGKWAVYQKNDEVTYAESGWDLYRTQSELVDLSKIKRAVTIDSDKQQLIEYLDIIDPVKGKISGIADQEIRYKTAFDPAVYSVGTVSTTVDTETSWITDHVGQLWWDLSTVKYVWYEQGDVQYRKNTWGKLFPGASIDVYEWVKSEYLPSQWSALADTTAGLAQGISGQPKYPDNSVISIQQYNNSTSGATTNVYYYWVRNKVTVPVAENRRMSASETARLIYDPAMYGTKTVSIVAPNAIVINNLTSSLIENRIYLNIAKDDINNKNNQHTEWLILAEGSDTSMPNTLLNKKLIDSLLGRDSIGNLVPDPALSDRLKYGIEVRPRQSMFKDRTAALRNQIEYANSILEQYQISNLANFDRLNSTEEIPDSALGEYDRLLENIQELSTIVTDNLQTAQLSCQLTNGRISVVMIDNPGYGYVIAPNVIIGDTENGAIITTEIDGNGSIIATTIVETGSNFSEAPLLKVRPFTAIIQIDSTISNRWSKQEWTGSAWIRSHTQKYNTSAYWEYIDWKSTDYDSLKPLSFTVEEPYLLAALTLNTGDYVKVNNQGNGKYIILRKVAVDGTFDTGYDLVYAEQGTIKIKDSIWKLTYNEYNFDTYYAYDQTLYDQTPDTELYMILLSLKEDIFVGSLKVYWNKFFFKAVRYAMSEQMFIDWAFKTAFINVKNLAGTLDQRPVYKFQNSQYYEDYLNEVKPYHTKIRNFQVNYDTLDESGSFITDFDLPAVYNTSTGKFSPLELTDALLQSYPYKLWYDNYKSFIGSITVTSPGSGYVVPPQVSIVADSRDTVTTATAVAYISLGKIIEVEIINPGSGYTVTPAVVFTGGSATETAKAYANLENRKVRSNSIGLKFDRVSSTRSIGERQTFDTFTAPGTTNEFVLTFAAENRKVDISIMLDGRGILSNDYNLVTYNELFNGYHKVYTKVVLNSVPEEGQILEITYNKSIDLYNAVDRIEDMYAPTSGMPGQHPAQLMDGVEYPGVQIGTLPFAYSANWDVMPFTDSGWDDDGFTDQALDSVIDGGDFDYNILWGLSPADIVLDGDAFLSPYVSHAPEECVPGQVLESLGITVYTSGATGSPLIYQTRGLVTSTATSTSITLGMLPTTTSSVMVSFNNRVMNYGTDYTVSVNSKVLTVNTQSTTGVLGITVVGVGGVGLLSYDYAEVSNTSTVSVISAQQYSVIGSAYVVLNGSVLTTSSYTMSRISVDDGRAKITVNGITTGTNILQAWCFISTTKTYSEVQEQFITADGSTSTFTLDQAPGSIGPAYAMVIVELNRRRLTPPTTVYYSASDAAYYEIHPTTTHPSGIFSLNLLEVHVNGVKIQNGIDFSLDQPNNRISFTPGVLSIGDVIAITNFMDNEYSIETGNLIIDSSITIAPSDVIKVITYTDHDGLLIRTEVFDAASSRRYPLGREVVNDDYVWVSVGGNPLINGFDYYIDNKRTVVIDGEYPYLSTDKVVVTSLSDTIMQEVLGYRIFKDILHRTTYKRISEAASTRLAAELYTTSTSITVYGGSSLTIPIPAANLPGVIIIGGERIEYMEKAGNILSRLKRATLGTGARSIYEVDTQVIDQGKIQNIPFTDTVIKEIITATSTTSYVINTISFSTSTDYQDQVEVYYGGVPLQKTSTISHDVNVAYDSSQTNTLGEVSDVVLLPEFVISGTGTNNVLTLNLPDDIIPGVRITVIKRTATDWYVDLGSLLVDSSLQANFLREQQAALPDKYHYGQ